MNRVALRACSCLVWSLTSLSPSLVAGPRALIYTAPVEDVIKHVDLVVRGRYLARTGTLTVGSVLLGSLDAAKIQVHNARSMPRAVHAEKEEFDAILFLRRFDDRFYLPVSSDPDWVSPHAAIKKAGADGMLVGLMQTMPGPPVWHRGRRTLQQLGKDLASWKESGRFASEASLPRKFKLRPEEVARFQRAIEPDLDFYTREVHSPSYAIPGFCGRVGKLLRNRMPAMKLRAAQALLYYGKQTGTPQPRREAAERTLIAFVEQRGAQWILPVLMDEHGSLDLRSNKRSAARILRAIGGKHAVHARDVLVRLRETARTQRRTRLETPIHFALAYLGFDPEHGGSQRQGLEDQKGPSSPRKPAPEGESPTGEPKKRD